MSEKDWREFMLSEIKEIKKSQDELKEMIYVGNINISNLKVKMGMISATVAIVSGAIASFVTSKLGS